MITSIDAFASAYIRQELRKQLMTRISIPYGNETVDISVPEKNIADIVYPREVSIENSYSVLQKAIRNPLGEQVIEDTLQAKVPVLIIVNDATRPTRTSMVLETIEHYVQNKHLQFIVATGAHRAPTEQELRTIFGKYYKEYQNRILIHDAQNKESLEYYGKTRYGNELWLNKAVARFERIFVIGSVEPHYFAGFTGGRKSILPGIAGYDTIEQNHKFAAHPKAQPLNLNGNPIHEEMVDCVKTLDDKQLLSIQMVLDRNYNIYDAFAGSIDRTFEMATRIAARLYRVRIPACAEIVVTVAQKPFDINLYQTLKAIEHGRMALRKGGILITISACSEGIGPASFARLFGDRNSLKTAALNVQSCYRLGDHNAGNLWNFIENNDLWVITTIPQDELANARIKCFATAQEAVDQAIKHKGKNTKVLFLLNGCFTVPEVV